MVAFGTGNFNAKDSTSSSGRIVHDSHAVVTARRSFMRLVLNMTLCDYPVLLRDNSLDS